VKSPARFLKPFVKEILECANAGGMELRLFEEPEKLQEMFSAGRQTTLQAVTQEINAILRQPKLVYGNPEEMPEPTLGTNPFNPPPAPEPSLIANPFARPLDRSSSVAANPENGKTVEQGGNFDDILQEMGSTLSSIGSFLDRDNAAQKGEASEAPNSEEGENLKPATNEGEEHSEEEGESFVPKTLAPGTASQSRKLAAFEEGLAQEARREQLTGWLREKLPSASAYQLETYLSDILEAERRNEIHSHLDFLRKTKGIDTQDFPPA
jgi:hypothetical protein